MKSGGHFTTMGEAQNLLYLEIREVTANWHVPKYQCQSFKREFAIHFEGCLNPSKGWIPTP